MVNISAKELSRQFRVLSQMLSMHAVLRDRYSRRALLIDILLLGCSVVFCATTFARDDLFIQLGMSPNNIRYLLGIASVIAFFASLVTLRADWKGKAACHREAFQKLGTVHSKFREFRQSDGLWPQDHMPELHHAYWEAMNNTVEIPDRLFVRLKNRHLKKVEISRISNSAPGCPLFLLRLILLKRSISRAFSKREPTKETFTDATGTQRDKKNPGNY
jgi:hypothetical protein